MKRMTGHIQVYSKQARDEVIRIGKNFLTAAGIPELGDELFSCVDELIKNCVKANYKFLFIKDRIHNIISSNHPEKKFNEIESDINLVIKNKKNFDLISDQILMVDNISGKVRDVLNQEANYLYIKNRAFTEKRKCTNDERKKIGSLALINKIHTKLKENGIKIILNIHSDKDYIFIEITNTAPILTNDLKRIYQKRKEYHTYMAKGKAHEFFINNLDTSESGFGLGYAKIDSILSDWGLEPDLTATIISSNNTTVMLTLPISELKKRHLAKK